MTLVDHKVVGQYTGFCYEEIVTDLGLEDEFRNVTGEELDDYEYDPTELSEDILIHQIIDEARDEYILYSDVVGLDERMYYSILKLEYVEPDLR